MTTDSVQNSTRQPAFHLPPTLLQAGDRMSRPEFLRLYEMMPEAENLELVEGVVYMSSPVSAASHGVPHSQLNAWLTVYAAHTPGLECGDNSTIHLDFDNAPQPDCYLRTLESVGGQSRMDKGYVVGAPELIAEVSSSSVSYDLHDKLRAYQRNGVQEYLVWRVRDCAIDWFVLRDGRYTKLAAGDAGVIQSQIYPGLWLAASALIDGNMPQVLETLNQGLASAAHESFVESLKR